MAGATTLRLGAAQAIGQTRFEARAATRETALVKWLILGSALTFFAVFLLMPLIAVFVEALRKGKRLLGLTPPGEELVVMVERMLLDGEADIGVATEALAEVPELASFPYSSSCARRS